MLRHLKAWWKREQLIRLMVKARDQREGERRGRDRRHGERRIGDRRER